MATAFKVVSWGAFLVERRRGGLARSAHGLLIQIRAMLFTYSDSTRITNVLQDDHGCSRDLYQSAHLKAFCVRSFWPSGNVLTLSHCSWQMLGDEIGKGAYGRVYKGLDLENGDFVAIKQVSLENIPPEDLASIMVSI